MRPIIRRKISILLLLAVALLFRYVPLQAQYFDIGQEPASVKWKTIRSPHLKIIFPYGMESKASYLAGALQYSRNAVKRSLDVDPKPITLILHNHTTYSNAFVPYAPKRMEFLTTPPQSSYPQPWLDQLVLHEYRHVSHYQKINQGFTKVLYYPFGEQAIVGILGAFVPFWFIEGDATVIETALSRSGRGRQPSFIQELRAQIIEKGPYNYDKATHGSFKDFVPDRYVLGYHLVGMTRSLYGKEAWNTALNRVAKYPFMLVPFSSGLKKTTGRGKVKLYRHITDTLRAAWEEKDRQNTLTDARAVTKRTGVYTDYIHPVVMNENYVAAIRRSIDDIDRIVGINIHTGEEKELVTPGINPFYDVLSGNGEKIIWGERIPDLRWDMRDYGVVIKYDPGTDRIYRLTGKTRYFAPVLSPRGDRIAVVEVNTDGGSSIIILGADTGKEISRYPGAEGSLYIAPTWSDDGRSLAAVVLDDEGKRLSIINMDTGKEKIILPSTNVDITYPRFFDRYILFTGGYSGIDNIYATDTATLEVYQVTSSRFGATQAAVSADGDVLYYADYTADGHRIVATPLDPGTWKSLDEVAELSLPLADEMASQEAFVYDPAQIHDTVYEAKRYRKGLHLFNPHSWAPISLDVSNVEDIMVNPGVSIFSQNLLSSSFASFRYEYDMNEETNRVFFDYTYAGQYPAFTGGVDHGGRKTTYIDSLENVYEVRWLETNLKAQVSLPLNLSRRQYFNTIRPYIQFDHTILTMADNMPVSFRYDRITSLRYGIFAFRQMKRSLRDLYPKWGQAIDLNYRHSFPGSSLESSIFSLEGYLFFPGIMKHHGLRIYASYQERTGNYRFSSMISIPRGYTGLNTDDLVSLKGDYVFPLFYPDWRLGPVIFIKRFKAGLFYDYAFPADRAGSVAFNSFGGDITTDLHLFSFIAPFEIGTRIIHIPEYGDTQFQFLFNINVGGIY